MKIDPKTLEELVILAHEKNVYLEGNILKTIEPDPDNAQLTQYLQEALTRDQSHRRKRLDITRHTQAQNTELLKTKKKLETALTEAQDAKSIAEQDLTLLQKKSQFKLINRVANISLFIIASISIASTLVYSIALTKGMYVDNISSTWNSLMGILLSNAFSVLATTMGIKYASDKSDKD